jgi:hypothetical protein
LFNPLLNPTGSNAKPKATILAFPDDFGRDSQRTGKRRISTAGRTIRNRLARAIGVVSDKKSVNNIIQKE